MRRLFGFITLAWHRLRSQAGLVACVLLGITIAVAFASAIPSFVNAAQSRVLRQMLLQSTGGDANAEGNALERGGDPLDMRFVYLGSAYGRLTWEQFQKLDDFMRARIEGRTILPILQTGVYINTDEWRVWPAAGTRTETAYKNRDNPDAPLAYVSMDSLPGLVDHIKLDEGELPQETGSGPIPVLVYRDFSVKYGVRAGDIFSLTVRQPISDEPNAPERRFETLAQVSGVWTPADRSDPFWFVNPSALTDAFYVTPETFEKRVVELLPKPIDFSIWYYALDDTAMRVELVDRFLARIVTLRNEVFAERPGMSLNTNIDSTLMRYQNSAGELTLLMIAFAFPLIVIILYFIVLVSGMVVRRQESELVTFRSRGASSANVLALYAVQGVIVGLLALAIGLPIGYLIASLMSGTRTFLDFSGPMRMSWPAFLDTLDPNVLSFRFGVGAAVLAVLAALLPAFSASRTNVVQANADRGRNTRKPFWQRFYLDLLLLIPVVYGYLQLRNQGSIQVMGRTLSQEDPLRDPVRYLLPMLLMTSIALLVARLFPLVMRLISRVTGRWGGSFGPATSLLLAARELARSPRDYIGPLLLLIIATAIATFGASTAKTLDSHLIDSTYFRAGADLRLVENGESNQPRISNAMFGSNETQPQAPQEKKPEYWSFMPVEDHSKIDGVEAFGRMTRLRAEPVVARQPDDSQIVAIDWREFHDVMKPAFRPDYAAQSFGALMNAIGEPKDNSGILVEPAFLSSNRLRIGDRLQVEVLTTEGRVPITYTVAGTYSYFPTIQPNPAQNVMIADIGYTFNKMGKAVPYDVLLATDPTYSGSAIADEARRLGFLVTDVFDARRTILEAQQMPERQGLFGVLTAGFFAAIVLTTVGFVLYALLSFRRRAVELGVLRTLGLSAWQMALYLIIAQLSLVVVGTLAGSAAGVLASRLFIPFFQTSGQLVGQVPAFEVRIAWNELVWVYAAIGLALFIALAATLLFLRRLRAFEAIKLGMVS
jgi:putative ABC transport system permease protein